ncbi:nuclear pore complex protein Nup88 [Episyrphus balteatus]|uniref:nuclear pore complex protein Nup88 n=1 Tax=Episyrphus balteatus TaxID=286459 RepID=UPI0024857531|nr:nuclear pore complex protein Nup88 [Episyrphus balteatus]
MFTTDIMNLNKSQMFEKIRSSLTIEANITQNLLECKDDLLYAWNSSDSSLLCVNWRAAHLKGFTNIIHQTLIPSTPLTFKVERVLASIEGSLVALSGPHGFKIIELPRRWGANGQFMDGKPTITCRSNNIDAHFFSNNPHIEIRQLRWHPASPTDSHLLVLLSDNTIRVYDNCTLRHVWQVGPYPMVHMNNANNSTKLPSPHSLGESSVDFDIGPAMTASSDVSFSNLNVSKSIVSDVGNPRDSLSKDSISVNDTVGKVVNEKVEWPIVVLRENGNIYILCAGIDSEKPRLQGPLTIRPQAIDNFGLDSCSILLISSLPPTIVIAESTGRLHHALLIQADQHEHSFNEVDSSLIIHPSEWTLEVLETIELELGIADTRNETSNSYSCPIHLKRDPVNEMRYFAYHNAGLHVVTVNFIAELERYLDTDVISDTPSLSNQSRAEYLVCTKISTGSKINAVLGFVLLQMPSGIVLLLSSGQVISLNLVIDTKLLLNPTAAIEPNTNKDRRITSIDNSSGLSFVEHIQNILKRSVTQPIMSLDKSAQPKPQESYELLTQTIEVLRTQYMKKHELVRSEFLQKLNAIKLQKEQQRKEIEYLERQKDSIQENAHRLAERFEEISETQDLLSKKCQNWIRQANTCLPSNAQAEKELVEEVEKINKTYKSLANVPQKAKENINRQSYHTQKYFENSKNKSFDLPEKQETTIKEILTQMMGEIEGQVKEVKRINTILNL